MINDDVVVFLASREIAAFARIEEAAVFAYGRCDLVAFYVNRTFS